MPHLLKVTWSRESERRGREREREESQSERQESRQQQVMSCIWSQHMQAVYCPLVRQVLHFIWILLHPHQSLFSLEKVQNAGAWFKEHWPALPEHVVWSQHSQEHKLRKSISAWAQGNDKAALVSTEGFHRPFPKEEDPGKLHHLSVRWEEQRQASIHLCCIKLNIVSVTVKNIVKVLNMVWLDYIQEVQLNCTWHLSSLAKCVLFLGQRSNVQSLHVTNIHQSAFEKQEQDHVVQITSWFLRMGHLRDLHLNSPSFLEGCLDQILRRDGPLAVTLNLLNIENMRMPNALLS